MVARLNVGFFPPSSVDSFLVWIDSRSQLFSQRDIAIQTVRHRNLLLKNSWLEKDARRRPVSLFRRQLENKNVRLTAWAHEAICGIAESFMGVIDWTVDLHFRSNSKELLDPVFQIIKTKFPAIDARRYTIYRWWKHWPLLSFL